MNTHWQAELDTLRDSTKTMLQEMLAKVQATEKVVVVPPELQRDVDRVEVKRGEVVRWACEHGCGFTHTEHDVVAAHETTCRANPANPKAAPRSSSRARARSRSRGRVASGNDEEPTEGVRPRSSSRGRVASGNDEEPTEGMQPRSSSRGRARSRSRGRVASGKDGVTGEDEIQPPEGMVFRTKMAREIWIQKEKSRLENSQTAPPDPVGPRDSGLQRDLQRMEAEVEAKVEAEAEAQVEAKAGAQVEAEEDPVPPPGMSFRTKMAKDMWVQKEKARRARERARPSSPSMPPASPGAPMEDEKMLVTQTGLVYYKSPQAHKEAHIGEKGETRPDVSPAAL